VGQVRQFGGYCLDLFIRYGIVLDGLDMRVIRKVQTVDFNQFELELLGELENGVVHEGACLADLIGLHAAFGVHLDHSPAVLAGFELELHAWTVRVSLQNLFQVALHVGVVLEDLDYFWRANFVYVAGLRPVCTPLGQQVD